MIRNNKVNKEAITNKLIYTSPSFNEHPEYWIKFPEDKQSTSLHILAVFNSYVFGTTDDFLRINLINGRLITLALYELMSVFIVS